jgi:Bleomycin resistance protein-like N-terminal
MGALCEPHESSVEESRMRSSQTGVDTATETPGLTGFPMRFEVTTVPVADVDRAKAFYQRLGWRLDIDFKPTPDTRGVQFTPPYFSRATFADPDGNSWQLQEITERLPGRV